VPPKFFVPVQEENPIGVATTGLKQLGGVVKCVDASLFRLDALPRKLTRPQPSQPLQLEPPDREDHGLMRGAPRDEEAERPPETRAV
jgi:hypothetical protein